MSRIDEINAQIQHLGEKIHEYSSAIAELEEAYDYIRQRKEFIEKDFFNPVKSFDMTRSEQWRGKLETDGESMQEKICHETTVALDDTARLLEDIHNAIENLKRLIRDCEKEIDALNAEKDSLLAEAETM